jgi:hypothetical protein
MRTAKMKSMFDASPIFDLRNNVKFFGVDRFVVVDEIRSDLESFVVQCHSVDLCDDRNSIAEKFAPTTVKHRWANAPDFVHLEDRYAPITLVEMRDRKLVLIHNHVFHFSLPRMRQICG